MIAGELLINKGQKAKIAILCQQLGIDKDLKAELVGQFTDGRETSSTGMTVKEGRRLIEALERTINKGQLTVDNSGRASSLQTRTSVEQNPPSLKLRRAKGDAMRKKIIHCAYQMGWDMPINTNPEVNGIPRVGRKIDMDRVNAWSVKYGYLHKPLNDYSDKELPELVTQMERVLVSYLKSV